MSEPSPSQGNTPSYADMASNIYRDGLKWAKAGFDVAPASEIDRRLAICAECEFFSQGRCKICGCFMRFKAKLSTGDCPKGKWNAKTN